MKKIKFNEKMRPFIVNIAIFRFLSDEEIDKLLSESGVYQCSKEESIIIQEEVDTALFAILKGNVKVTVDNTEGKAYICTLGPGEIFGEAGMFMNVHRTANVISLEDSIILRIEREQMLRFIKKNPNAGNKIFMIIIYGLLTKLKEANRELAYERKGDYNQTDIDDLINNLIN